jgi:hypothetical protein
MKFGSKLLPFISCSDLGLKKSSLIKQMFEASAEVYARSKAQRYDRSGEMFHLINGGKLRGTNHSDRPLNMTDRLAAKRTMAFGPIAKCISFPSEKKLVMTKVEIQDGRRVFLFRIMVVVFSDINSLSASFAIQRALFVPFALTDSAVLIASSRRFMFLLPI